MKTLNDLVTDSLQDIEEIFPWDLADKIEAAEELILLDVREPAEFEALHIAGSINVPRGILESACDWGYDETVPDLVRAREQEVIVICRSGVRSALAAQTMKNMGFQSPVSLKTGVRGWNDFEQPLINKHGEQVDIDDADEILASRVRPDQMPPK